MLLAELECGFQPKHRVIQHHLLGGGIMDHSSHLPDQVAMSSAKVEYNEGCITFMATCHLRMLLAELEGVGRIKHGTNNHFL
jgi:hypothetical protein